MITTGGGRGSGWLAFIVLGVTALCLHGFLAGLPSLWPGNESWLLKGDPAQHYLGWQFFRNDLWRWPLGSIQGYGLCAGASVVFTDSIPLLALFFKAVSGLLPEKFQYFGLWMLACFFLNGYFAYRLLCRTGASEGARILGSLFFIVSPPLFMRAYGHEALMAHWVLLAGIEAYLRGWKIRSWAGLTALSLLIHPYIFLMQLGWMTASLFKAWQQEGLPARRLGRDAFLIGLLCLALMLAVGHLTTGGRVAGEGYGFFSMNLLALFEPVFIDASYGASPFLMHHKMATEGQYEGYLYLGAGMLILATVALGAWLTECRKPACMHDLRRYLPLAVVAFVFWLVALSNQITLAGEHLLTIPLPEILQQMLSVFRASGRLGWPLYYLLTLGILACLFSRLPSHPLSLLLALALMLQLADMAPKYKALRQVMKQRQAWESPLRSEEWTVWAKQAKRLVIVAPHPPMEQIYLPFAHLAGRYGLATNAVHLARPVSCNTSNEYITLGTHDSRTIFVFLTEKAKASLYADLQSHIRYLDDYAVLPPGIDTNP